MVKKGKVARTFRYVSAVTIILMGTSIISEGSLKATEYGANSEEYNDEKIHEVIGEDGDVKNIGEISMFSIQNVGEYTPRTKQITGHATSDYDDGEFRGTLERYVMRGSPADTKAVTGHPTSSYNKDGYTGTLTQYLESGLPEDTKHVTGQTSASYNKDGYKGTLTQYVASGSASDTKYVTNQTSSSYNSGGYTGTLTQYEHSGSASQSKYVEGQTSANYSDSSGYSGTLTQYLYSGSYTPSDTIYVTGQTSRYYNSGGYTGTLSEYLAGGSSSSSMYVTNQTSSYYNSGGYSGYLGSYTATVTPAHSKTETVTLYTVMYEDWIREGGQWVRKEIRSSANAPATMRYNSGGYSGTLTRSDGGNGTRIYDDGLPGGVGF